jgi:hypothetical protein
LAAERVRRLVGPDVRLYYVPGEHLLGRLQRALGAGLAVAAGCVRVFWPGLSRRSDPAAHPLVVLLEHESEHDALREFARVFDLSRPAVRAELRLIEDARALLDQQLADSVQECQALAERLRDIQVERHVARTRAEAAEELVGFLAGRRVAVGCQTRLRGLIIAERLRLFGGVVGEDFPLGGYRFARAFLEQIEREQAELPLARVARVCAILASGYTPAFKEIAPKPLPDVAPACRSEDSKRWHCLICRSPARLDLHYQLTADGMIEFLHIQRAA